MRARKKKRGFRDVTLARAIKGGRRLRFGTSNDIRMIRKAQMREKLLRRNAHFPRCLPIRNQQNFTVTFSLARKVRDAYFVDCNRSIDAIPKYERTQMCVPRATCLGDLDDRDDARKTIEIGVRASSFLNNS
jgi:hypothetical protein